MDNTRLQQYIELTRTKRRLDKQLKDTNAALAAMEEDILTDFAAEGIDRITVDGMNLKPSSKLWASCVDEQYDAACDALIETGYSDYVQRRFNANSLSALARELAANEMPIPDQWDGLIKVTEKWTISATEAKRG